MTKMTMLLAALVCLLGAASGFEDKTVFQYLKDNPTEFSTLADLIKVAGLEAALDGTGPFTIFAPTNAAFTALGAPALTSLQNNPTQLSQILQYHVIQEFVLVPMINQLTNKTTLNGDILNITTTGGQSLIVNGNSLVSNYPNNDIIVNNGVIQPVNSVLSPPVQATLNIAQILVKDDARFQDLSLALLLAGMDKVLESGDYTLFAPINSAFTAFQGSLLSPDAPNAQAVYQAVLRNHLVPGARRAKMLSDNQSLFTLHGSSLTVKKSGTAVSINNANVTEADILATNGVIHAIDTLLVPADINTIAQG